MKGPNSRSNLGVNLPSPIWLPTKNDDVTFASRHLAKRRGMQFEADWGLIVMSAKATMQLKTGYSHRQSQIEKNQERLVDVLMLVYGLLEEYAPSWYTQQHHETLLAALHTGKANNCT